MTTRARADMATFASTRWNRDGYLEAFNQYIMSLIYFLVEGYQFQILKMIFLFSRQICCMLNVDCDLEINAVNI